MPRNKAAKKDDGAWSIPKVKYNEGEKPLEAARLEFPEVDRAAWFGVDEAIRKLTKGQVGFIEELKTSLRAFFAARCPHIP
jgi:predicted NUDIX family NTP pyrophosphohydrolase